MATNAQLSSAARSGFVIPAQAFMLFVPASADGAEIHIGFSQDTQTL
jgi:hypothetical protein